MYFIWKDKINLTISEQGFFIFITQLNVLGGNCNDNLNFALRQKDACISPNVRFCILTDQFHIFNCRVNPKAPVEASLKGILIRYIFEKVETPTPYRWNSKKCLLTNPKTAIKNFKICNIPCRISNRVENLLCFPLFLTVFEIMANLHFRVHVTMRAIWRKNWK